VARTSAIAALALAFMIAAPRAGQTEPGRARDSEFNFVPIAGGDSDKGLGFGEVSNWAGLRDPSAHAPTVAAAGAPYRWRIENGAFITFNHREHFIVPYQDYYVLATIPDVGGNGRLRLDVRAAYSKETTLKYYGIGNASPDPPPGTSAADSEYGWIHPAFSIRGRIALASHLLLQIGGVYVHSSLSIPEGSLLATDRMAGSPTVQALLRTPTSFAVALAEVGVEYDSRDNDIITRNGMYHGVQVRLSPASGDRLPQAYAELNGIARFYFTPIPRWLTIAARVAGDLLLGSPPFYELARYSDTDAVGGGKGVRGVPAQRYYGKVKVLGNLELRCELLPFRVRTKALMLGGALFADGGRVWTELTHAHPELDGTGLGMKYGIGGGLRLQQGETFVVRLDVAWSPDARPVGAYFAAGQIF
jgi:outer membrane protein assembly factor BamA